MALLKDKTLSTGFTGSYWRIDKVSGDDLNKIANVSLSLYKDQVTSQINNGTSIETLSFRWAGDNYPFTKAALDSGINIYGAAYMLVKRSRMSEEPFDWSITNPGETFVPVETNWFADSIDV